MYGLSAADEDIQARARVFADELIPFEVQAELDGGLRDDVAAAHKKRAIELGLFATNMPRDLGGVGASALQQVLVQEQVGRVTNALGWVAATPPSWFPPVATDDQIERYLKPTVRGEREECYAITEASRRLRRGRDRGHRPPRRRRVGAERRQVARHQLQLRRLLLLPGQEDRDQSVRTHAWLRVRAQRRSRHRAAPSHRGSPAEHLLFLVDLPSPGVTVVRTPAYSHTISHHHPIVEFTDVRVPAANLVGGEGDGMLVLARVVPFRAADGRGPLHRRRRAPGRGDDRVRDDPRVAGGVPIAAHGLVAGMLADSVTELFAARSMLYETARGIDRDPSDVKTAHAQCSMIKLYCSEMASRVADRAVQVFGGRGYMRENVAERFFRELRVERIWEGTSEIQRMIIAGQLASRGPAALALFPRGASPPSTPYRGKTPLLPPSPGNRPNRRPRASRLPG